MIQLFPRRAASRELANFRYVVPADKMTVKEVLGHF